MYTGIVQELGRIETVVEQPGYRTFAVACSTGFLDGLEVGASVAIDGTCFTATSVGAIGVGAIGAGAIRGGASGFTVDAVDATLAITNAGRLRPGVRVNLERSSHVGAEVGGHIIAGHVAGTAPITRFTKEHPGAAIELALPEDLRKYVFPKGFLAVNGASLTVETMDPATGTVRINLIPETLRKTNFVDHEVGDPLNIEIDAQTRTLVDTVERMMAAQFQRFAPTA